MKFKNILGDARQKIDIENIQSDFVSLASHQLRTPLSVIRWYTEILMKQKVGKLSAKQLQYLKEIYRSSERAINLVNDLLDVSHIQEGGIHLEYRPARIEDVIEETIDNFGTLIKISQVSVNFEIINGPLPEIEVDREKIKRVIVNLLSNSVKYTMAKGKIKITAEKIPNYIRITVQDSGIGIPKSDQGKVFGKFFRSANVIKMVPDGTGLGLYIAKSLTDAMDVKMGFKSDEGKGTTFYFTLPLKV